jgi:NmrA-like family
MVSSMEGTNDVGTRAEALVAQQMPAELAARGAPPTAVGWSGGPQEAAMLPNGSMTARERNQNMAQALTVVVTVSTGKQGGAVARRLLERGHKLRAVTGDPNSSPAKVAAKAGSSSDLGGGR